MRTFVIEFLPEAIELPLLGREIPRRGLVASAFKVLCMRSCRPFCWGLPGSISSGNTPSRTHQAERLESLASVLVANGTPLSVRIRVGNPNSLNRRVNTGLASFTAVVSVSGSRADSGCTHR